MTGEEALDYSLRLLGYTDAEGLPEAGGGIKGRAIAAVNAVYSDLFYLLHDKGFTGLRELKDEIALPERVLRDVLPYGVAAFLAQGEKDGDSQRYFMEIYNNKRHGVAGSAQIEDVLPEIWYGE